MSVTTQQDSKPRSIAIHGLYVDVSPPTRDQDTGGSPVLHTNSPLAEDILRVAETAYRVIDRLSNGVTFAEQASVPARLSEAIFRVLRTDTYPGEVMKVVVQLEEAPVVEHLPLSTDSHPSVDSSTSAGLRTDIDPRTSAGNLPRGVTRTDRDPLTSPAVTPVETDWWASNGMSSMGPTQFRAALASVQPGLLQGTRGRGVLLLNQGGILITVDPALKFPELFDATGLSALQIQVTWSPVSAFGALRFNAERIEDMCQMSAKNYAGRGFDTLRTLVDELIASLPEQPHVHLLARIGRSSNNTPSVAPYTTPRLARVSIAVSERSSAKDLPVKFMLPRIYGFVVPERPTKSFVEVILTGRLPYRPDLTGTVDMDVAAAHSVKAVTESAAPIFSALGSVALDDHLAGRIANSLLHAEAVFPHEIRPEGVDVRIGTAEGAAPSTGTASVFVARVIQSRSSNDPPPPSLPPGIDTFDLQAETIPTGSQSHQEEAEDANDSTEPPSEAVSQRETPPSREGEEVLVSAGFKVHIPPILSSTALTKRSGPSTVGCTVIQPAHGCDAKTLMSPSAVREKVLKCLDTESGHGLRYLHSATVAVCKSSPSITTFTLHWKSPRRITRDKIWSRRRSFDGTLDIFITTHAGAQIAGSDGGDVVRLVFTQTLWTARSTRDLPDPYLLIVDIDSSYALLGSDDDAKPLHSLAGMVRALRDTQESMTANLDPVQISDALVTRAADAIAHMTTLLPPNRHVQRVSARIEERRVVRGRVSRVVLGRGSWEAGGNSLAQSGRICVALGSNVGDRLRSIETACNAIDREPDMRLVQTSSLYETEPMYVQDQERFLNGVCEIDTTLRPMDLLDKLQAIEHDMGRVKTVDKGPRSIDLDLLLYKSEHLTTDRLTVPHALMWEREFVLRPLRDVLVNRTQGAVNPRSLNDSLQRVEHKPLNMFSQVPLGPESAFIRANDPKRPTRVMSILNVTPDSFSDGGKNDPTEGEALKATVLSHIASGATIIDVGGQSSRPNAPNITADEELARILPAIAAIKSLPEAAHIAISIDTYRAAVASAAVEAGAHIINDISAGTLDPDMLPTIARLGCTYVMMHMRGTPATMQDPENLAYPFGLIHTICVELRARLDAAQAAGIRRWRIILDPGIGFAKTPEQNVEILRDLPALVGYRGLENIPWMVGSSRKGFIGKITGVEVAKERSWGTAATVTAAVQGGASVVRVHDVGEMAQVVKMADAMYRV